MKIRPYTSEDKELVIQLLHLNTPKYFAISEHLELERYLETELEDYFVVEKHNQLIGAGGINYFTKERKARIAWDVISPDWQGMGIGSILTKHRILHINKHIDVDLIVVRTSQLVYKFYEKLGFNLVSITKDYWAKGYDLYLMEQENERRP